MPDEVSHLVLTYLALKHPRLKKLRDFQSAKGVLATYLFAVLPDLGNLAMILILLGIMVSNNLPIAMGHGALEYPQVREAHDGVVGSIYYIFHSYVTYALLILVFYLVLRRIYWPLAFGMGLHLTIDMLTHREPFALKPLYPVIDTAINGVFHWGSWKFYILETLFVLIYTIWLFKKQKNR